MDRDIQVILKKTGALKRGHFQLSSGLHSEFYLQCALVLQHPEYAEFLGKEIANKVRAIEIDTVISPAIGGIVIGYEVARALNIRAIFAERVQGKFTLRRGFEIHSGEKVLIVEDVVTTGGSSREIGSMVKLKKGHVVGYASICDRRDSKTNFKEPFYSLIRFNFKNYMQEKCPFCLKKIPLSTPGSRFTTQVPSHIR